MKHLTDNEIQSYLQELPTEEETQIELHLSECPGCRKRLLLYKKLGEVVVSASEASVPEDFGTAVVGRLRAIRRLKRISDFVVAAIAIGGFVLVGLFIFLTPQFKYMVAENITELWYSATGSVGNTAESSGTTGILVFAAGLFVFFSIIDRLIIGKLRPARGQRRYFETG